MTAAPLTGAPDGVGASHRARTLLTQLERRVSAVPLLAVAGAVCAATLLALGWSFTFFQDEWDIVLHRRGLSADAFLRPHNEHLFLIPIALYKGLVATFGIDSTAPMRIVHTAFLIVAAVLLFIYVRRRVGDWLALIAAVVIMFFGPAWEDLFLPLQISVGGAVAAGLGALLALEREDRRGDMIACVLLTLSMAFSSLGIPFIAGAFVAVLARRGQRLARLYIPGIPLLLFMLWYAGYGHTAASAASMENILTAPRFLFDGLAASLSTLVGLGAESPAPEAEGASLDWGRPLLVAAAAIAAWRLFRGPAVSRRIWIVVVATIAFWLLAGVNELPGRTPFDSRYVYSGAIFIILIAAELCDGLRIRAPALAAIAALAAFALFSNLAPLGGGWRFFRTQSDLARANLAAIEISRDTVDPAFTLDPEIADTTALSVVDAGSYLSAVDAFGSPAYTPAELAERPESVRSASDLVLSRALPIELRDGGFSAAGERQQGDSPTLLGPSIDSASARGGCVTVRSPVAGSPPQFQLPPGGAVLRVGKGEPVPVSLRRFAAESFSVSVGAVVGGSTATVTIPPDRGTEPWELQLEATQPVTVCGQA